MKRLTYFLFFVLLTGMVCAQQAKYVFYFIGDGMGVNQVNGTEMYLAEQKGRIGVEPLLFTQFPAVGVATTFSATNSVTDSSAAGDPVRCREGEESREEGRRCDQCQCGSCHSCRFLCPSAQSQYVL